MISSPNSTPESPFPAPPQVPSAATPPVPRVPTPPVRSPAADSARLPPEIKDPTAPRTNAPSATPATPTSKIGEGAASLTNAFQKLADKVNLLSSGLANLADATKKAEDAAKSAAQAAGVAGGGGAGGGGAGGAGGGGAGGAGGGIGRLGAAVGMGAAGALNISAGGAGGLFDFLGAMRGQAERFRSLQVIAGFEGLRQQVELPALQLGRLSTAGGTPAQILQALGGEAFTQIGVGPAQQAQILQAAASARGGGLTAQEAARAAQMTAAGEDVGAFFSLVGQRRARGLEGGADLAGEVARGLGLRGGAGASMQSQLVSAFLAQRSLNLGAINEKQFYQRALQLGQGDFAVGLRSYERGQGIAQQARQDLLAPFQGLGESALMMQALREAGGDRVQAAQILEQYQAEGVTRLQPILEQTYGKRTAEAVLRAEGYTTRDIEAMAKRREMALVGVGEVGMTQYTASRAAFERERLARSEQGDNAARFDVMLSAERQVEEQQLRRGRVRFPSLTNLDNELYDAVKTVGNFSERMDRLNEALGKELLNSVTEADNAIKALGNGFVNLADVTRVISGGLKAAGISKLLDFINSAGGR